MAVAIKPLEDRIVVKANDAEQTTALMAFDHQWT
ncbi:MAG: hypothetical protein RL129_1435 [Actinomycetota bacterium]